MVVGAIDSWPMVLSGNFCVVHVLSYLLVHILKQCMKQQIKMHRKHTQYPVHLI